MLRQRDFSDVRRIDGALLPLLARWIGWPTDFGQSLDKQRNEISYAPHFYRTSAPPPISAPPLIVW